MKNNIHRDLPIGHKGEKRLMSILQSLGLQCWKNDGSSNNLTDWDISVKAGNKNITFEVKNDVYSLKSGNIAIETFNPKSKKQSGLSITKADFWCHITSQVYVTPVFKLKKYLEANKPFRHIACGGDKNATLYLYKEAEIIPDIFTAVSGISKRQLLENWNLLIQVYSNHEG